MSFIWVSDLHVKPASSYRKTLLTGDAFYALDQIQRAAITRRVDAVILGGDVYDSNQPPGEAINRLALFIGELRENGIATYYIEGNHDRVNRNPYLPKVYYNEPRLLSSIGAIPINGMPVVIDGLTIMGIDYLPAEKLRERLETQEPCDVLCLHAGFRHMLGFEEAYDLTKEHVPATVRKAVLVGHIHTRSSTTTDRGVYIHSSGSTWPWRVDEAQKEHGFFLFEHGNVATPTYVQLDCRKYYDIDEEQDILITLAEDHALPPVLRYVRDKMPYLDHSRYGDDVKLVPMSGDAATEELLDANEEHAADLLEALVIGVPFDSYPEEHAFMKALLESEDPVGFLTQYLIDRGVTLKAA